MTRPRLILLVKTGLKLQLKDSKAMLVMSNLKNSEMFVKTLSTVSEKNKILLA